MYRPENLSIGGTRFLGRWNGIIPVYDVLTMQGGKRNCWMCKT